MNINKKVCTVIFMYFFTTIVVNISIFIYKFGAIFILVVCVCSGVVQGRLKIIPELEKFPNYASF